MLLFRNRRNGSFEEVSKASDLDDIPLESRRGAAFGDINNDGCVDIVVLNVGAPPSLLLNHCQNGNHRVLFQLLATKSNRLAIGARVSVRTGKLMQMSEVKGGSSYISQSDLRSRRPNRGIRAVSTISFVTLAETFASPKSHRKRFSNSNRNGSKKASAKPLLIEISQLSPAR